MKRKSTDDTTIREVSAAEFKTAKKFKDAFPDEHESWKRGRGRPKSSKPRVNKTLRLPADLVSAMEASGKYSARAEKALRQEFLKF